MGTGGLMHPYNVFLGKVGGLAHLLTATKDRSKRRTHHESGASGASHAVTSPRELE